MKFNLPSKLTAILALVAGVLAVLNQFVFKLGSDWSSAVTVALVFISGLGISPLFGQAWESKFKSILHIGPGISLLISSGIAALTVAVTTFSITPSVKHAIVVVLTVLAGLGFAPATAEVVRA